MSRVFFSSETSPLSRFHWLQECIFFNTIFAIGRQPVGVEDGEKRQSTVAQGHMATTIKKTTILPRPIATPGMVLIMPQYFLPTSVPLPKGLPLLPPNIGGMAGMATMATMAGMQAQLGPVAASSGMMPIVKPGLAIQKWDRQKLSAIAPRPAEWSARLHFSHLLDNWEMLPRRKGRGSAQPSG